MERRLEVLRKRVQLLVIHGTGSADVRHDRSLVANSLDNVAGTGLAFRTNECRSFGYPPERLAKVLRSADKGHLERMLVDVVLLIRRRQYFRLIDVVNADSLEDLVSEMYN